MKENDFQKRSRGQFYTPLPYSSLATEYMNKVWGDLESEKYAVWDMCAGTGNLFRSFVSLKNCFLSTIDDNEVKYLNSDEFFKESNIWQYNFLKDDIDFSFEKNNILNSEKVPQGLKDFLSSNSFEDLIIFINPPYSAHGAGINSGVSKVGVEETLVKKCMSDYGRSKMDLCNQFIFRIMKEFPGCKLGIFSPLKYIGASVDEKFREEIFRGKFEGGFVFPMSEFEGIVSQSPVAFAMYDTSKNVQLKDQDLIFDIYNKPENKIGYKKVISPSKAQLFTHNNGEKKKPKILSPPLKNAITLGSNIYTDKLDNDAFGFFHCKSNNVQSAHQKTAFFSTVFSQGGGIGINKDNFERLMVLHAVRRIPTHTWMNAQDQFIQVDYSDEFANDCLIWSLFSSKNLSSSFSIDYKENNFFIRNEFFPFKTRNGDLTFVGNILTKKVFSKEAMRVLKSAQIIYALFDVLYNDIDKDKWKIENHTPGWYQIRKALEEQEPEIKHLHELSVSYKVLNDKIRENIYNLGFLIPEEFI